jgi:NAD(P)-dependent dehydrogenase (short-subunit alcohol dehydrogenase family)
MTDFNRDTTGREVVKAYGSRLNDKTIVITGASDGGLGAATAVALADASPAHIILLARSTKKVTPVQEKIAAVNPSVKTSFISIELDDFDSVRKAAAEVNDLTDHIDVLLNNAGIMAVPEFTTNKDGIELQFATNHLGHFLLTALLFPKIEAAGPGARIVNLTSDGHELAQCHFEDYNFSDGKKYHPFRGYGQSKTANILFTTYLAKHLSSRQIYSFTLHPGVIMSTGISKTMTDEMVRTADEIAKEETGVGFTIEEPKDIEHGIATSLIAILDPRLEQHNGAYLEDGAIAVARSYATSEEGAERLWELSEKLVKQEFKL